MARDIEMGQQLTLDMPDDVLRRAEYVAAATRRDVTDVVRDALAGAFPPLEDEPAPGEIERLPDDRLMALCNSRLPEQADARFSELLLRRQSGEIDDDERSELTTLAQAYQALWLRQSAALAEGVRRGLRPPLAS